MASQREIMLAAGWLTITEAARRVGVNAATIYRMANAGKLGKLSKAGPLTYISAQALAEHYREAQPIWDRIMEGVGVPAETVAATG